MARLGCMSDRKKKSFVFSIAKDIPKMHAIFTITLVSSYDSVQHGIVAKITSRCADCIIRFALNYI